MRLLLRQQTLLVLLAGLIFVTNLGSYALFNDAEPKNASCAAEMLRRSDWIVPTFNDELRTDKPILPYWMMLVSFRFLGITEFSARIGSALMSVGTTILTYHLGRKLYSAQIGFHAAIIVSTLLLFCAAGRSVTPDSTLVFFVTLTFTGYVWAVSTLHRGHFVVDYPESPKPFTERNLASTESDVGVENDTENEDDNTEDDNTSEQSASYAGHLSVRQLVPNTWWLAVPMFAAMGFAVLTKGPVGFALPLAIIALFLLYTARSEDLRRGALKTPGNQWLRYWLSILAQTFRPGVVLEVFFRMNLVFGICIISAIALPWYFAVGFVTEGEWIQRFLIDHNFHRMIAAKDHHDGFPFFYAYYFLVLLLGCFPWSVFLPAAIANLWSRSDENVGWRDSDRLILCWACVWFIAFSIIATRMPNYLLPMFPAVALIVARYFHDWEREEDDVEIYEFGLYLRALGVIGALLIVGLYITAYLFFSSEQSNTQWIGLIGFVPAVGSFIAIRFLDREERKPVIQTVLWTGSLFAILLFGVAPASIGPYQDSKNFVMEARKFAGTSNVQMGTYQFLDSSLVFYAGEKVRMLETPLQVANFLASYPHAYVIAKASQHPELREELKDDVRELSRHRRFLDRTSMILIGRD